jgi:hypothetical protein
MLLLSGTGLYSLKRRNQGVRFDQSIEGLDGGFCRPNVGEKEVFELSEENWAAHKSHSLVHHGKTFESPRGVPKNVSFAQDHDRFGDKSNAVVIEVFKRGGGCHSEGQERGSLTT